jgi:hypothetical protein
MLAYTVRKPGGTKDREFDAYKGLLEESGIDLSRVPRTQESASGNRWLYVWRDRILAERFTRELSTRTRDRSWEVVEFDRVEEEVGPLAPLDIVAERIADGTVFRLTSTSQERIMRRFPNSQLGGEVFWGTETRRRVESVYGPIWDQVAKVLTGLSEVQWESLGGYRILELSEIVLYEGSRQ